MHYMMVGRSCHLPFDFPQLKAEQLPIQKHPAWLLGFLGVCWGQDLSQMTSKVI